MTQRIADCRPLRCVPAAEARDISYFLGDQSATRIRDIWRQRFGEEHMAALHASLLGLLAASCTELVDWAQSVAPDRLRRICEPDAIASGRAYRQWFERTFSEVYIAVLAGQSAPPLSHAGELLTLQRAATALGHESQSAFVFTLFGPFLPFLHRTSTTASTLERDLSAVIDLAGRSGSLATAVLEALSALARAVPVSQLLDKAGFLSEAAEAFAARPHIYGDRFFRNAVRAACVWSSYDKLDEILRAFLDLYVVMARRRCAESVLVRGDGTAVPAFFGADTADKRLDWILHPPESYGAVKRFFQLGPEARGEKGGVAGPHERALAEAQEISHVALSRIQAAIAQGEAGGTPEEALPPAQALR